MKMNQLLGFLIVMVLFHSCSVQKCLYSKGWNVDFHNAFHPNGSTVILHHPMESEKKDMTLPASSIPSNAAQKVTLSEETVAQKQVTLAESSSLLFKTTQSPTHFDGITRVAESKKSKLQRNVLVKPAPHLAKVADIHTSPLAPDWLLLLLCFFLPPIAVFIMTNGNLEKVLISLLLWILGIAPGIVYAFLVYLHYL
jgi:uncharacterized membrane protein YqaE (UPF0057 family)